MNVIFQPIEPPAALVEDFYTDAEGVQRVERTLVLRQDQVYNPDLLQYVAKLVQHL